MPIFCLVLKKIKCQRIEKEIATAGRDDFHQGGKGFRPVVDRLRDPELLHPTVIISENPAQFILVQFFRRGYGVPFGKALAGKPQPFGQFIYRGGDEIFLRALGAERAVREHFESFIGTEIGHLIEAAFPGDQHLGIF